MPDSRIPDYDDPGHAAKYGKRPGTTRSEQRAIRRLVGDLPGGLTVLDVPCGNGRLGPTLRALEPRSLLGSDGAPAMLDRARSAYDGAFCADALRLPLSDRSIDLVMCVRLLHHFPGAEERVALLRELGRVARVRVVVSLYRLTSLQGLRRRLRPRPSARVGLSIGRFRREARSAGLLPLGAASLLPFVREQTFFLLAPETGPCETTGLG